MSLRLRRNLGPVRALDRAEWTSETASGHPAICCPSCERVSELDMETHRVLTGGVVSPVWMCPHAGCPVIEFISLEAWGEEVVPA